MLVLALVLDEAFFAELAGVRALPPLKAFVEEGVCVVGGDEAVSDE